MKTVDALRAEADRLRNAAQVNPEPQQRVRLAARALGLAERAEAIERSQGHPEIVRANIVRYRSMLRAVTDDEDHRQNIEDMLADAQALLARAPVGDIDRFVSERNIGLFARQLCDERDPATQQTLHRLLIDEEHRYGPCASGTWHWPTVILLKATAASKSRKD